MGGNGNGCQLLNHTEFTFDNTEYSYSPTFCTLKLYM